MSLLWLAPSLSAQAAGVAANDGNSDSTTGNSGNSNGISATTPAEGAPAEVTQATDAEAAVAFTSEAAPVAEPATVDALASPFTHAPLVLRTRELRGLTSNAASLVLHGVPGGNFALEALATPLPLSEDGKSTVPIFMEIDGAGFLDTNRSERTRVEVYAYALSKEGSKLADYLAEVFAVRVSGLGEAVWQSGFKFYGHLRLEPGEYRLRVLVRNYQSEAAALRELALTVPGAEGGNGGQILFPGPRTRDSWLPIRESAADSPMAAGKYPFVLAGQVISPSARPVMVAGRPSEVWFLAPGASGDSLPKAVLWSGEQRVAKLEVSGESSASDMRKLLLTAPVEVRPGPYQLKLGGETGDGLEMPVFVLSDQVREHELLWTDLRWLLSGSEADQSAIAATAVLTEAQEEERKKRRSRRKLVRKLAQSYREILSLLGSGDQEAAFDRLFDLESAVLAGDVRGSMALLEQAQVEVATGLAAAEPESLIPALMMHDALYRRYRQRHLFSLVSHSRHVSEQIVLLYAENGGTEGARRVAARALASLGGYAQQANLPNSSRRLFRLALQQNPQNLAALLGLATGYERESSYLQAAEALEALGQAHPDFNEGRLRRAMNLHRTGDRSRAKEMFSAAAGDRQEAWVRCLAAEELARALMESGRFAEAAAALEDVRKDPETPFENSSRVLLAHIYDRLGRVADSAKLLEEVSQQLGSQRSARKAYDSWPARIYDSLRKELSATADSRHSLLGATLGNLEEAD